MLSDDVQRVNRDYIMNSIVSIKDFIRKGQCLDLYHMKMASCFGNTVGSVQDLDRFYTKATSFIVSSTLKLCYKREVNKKWQENLVNSLRRDPDQKRNDFRHIYP